MITEILATKIQNLAQEAAKGYKLDEAFTENLLKSIFVRNSLADLSWVDGVEALPDALCKAMQTFYEKHKQELPADWQVLYNYMSKKAALEKEKNDFYSGANLIGLQVVGQTALLGKFEGVIEDVSGGIIVVKISASAELKRFSFDTFNTTKGLRPADKNKWDIYDGILQQLATITAKYMALRDDLEKLEELFKMWFFMEKNDIHYVYHFTPLGNLPSILKHGIVPRQACKNAGIPCEYTDYLRFDGQINASCLSIGFPNYKMFYRKRNEFPKKKWAVIEIDSQIILELACRFYPTNAARNDMCQLQTSEVTGYRGLTKMFARNSCSTACNMWGWQKFYTTDPQAELLVYETIPSKRFKKIFVQESCPELVLPASLVVVDDSFFKPRCDWELWQSDFSNMEYLG